MAGFPFGVPTFGVRDAKVAIWDGDGTYQAAVDVMSVRVLGFQLNTNNAQLEGDDKITDTHAVVISGTVNLAFGGTNPDVLEVILGRDAVVASTAPTRTRTMSITGLNLPYFGLVGKMNSTRGGADQHIFVPMLKVMEGFQFRYEYGAYSIPELTCTAIIDDNFVDTAGESVLAYLKWHETGVAVAIPPVGITPVEAEE